MSLPSVVWSNCREMGMIGGMKQGSFQSRLVHCSFYFAQELVSLSRPCIHGSLASRNFLLPSRSGLKQFLRFHVRHQAFVGMAWEARSGLKRPSRITRPTNVIRRNGLGSLFGIETFLLALQGGRSRKRRNGLGSPFGIETQTVEVISRTELSSEWPGKP